MNLLLSYLRERFRPAIFGPVIVGHAAAGMWAAGARPTGTSLALSLTLSTLLILQFRLWDDLEDRDHDRVAHPGRLLTRVPEAPFHRTLPVLFAAPGVLLVTAHAWQAFLGLILVNAAFLLGYRLRYSVSETIWRHRLLLLKYPAFIWLICAALNPASLLSGRLLAAAGFVYVCSGLYEALHDRLFSWEATS